MDLLDSILNGMEKPPSVKRPEIKDKDKREKFEKLQKERQEAARKQKELMDKFRSDLARKLRSFVNTPTTDDPKSYKLELKPMNKLYRSIVHEISEEHEQEIVVHSFGVEDEDRHCVIWRKGFEPCDEEIRAMKLGVEYKPERNDEEEEEEESQRRRGKASGSAPGGKDKFWEKYEKIIGENASGVESARVALPAKQYGCVPIENKKDQRSIEQMIDDLRKTKKQKTAGDEKPSVDAPHQPEETGAKEGEDGDAEADDGRQEKKDE